MSKASDQGRFVWHELMTSDPIAAQRFYSDVIGWTTTKSSMGDMDYTMWVAGNAPIGGVMAFTPDAAKMGAPPSWLAYVEVPDVDATVAKALELHGSVVVPAMTIPTVGRFAVLRDPQGAVIAAITSEAPLGDETDPPLLTFSWHELVATDYKAADDFYRALFGWKTVSDYDMGDMGVYHLFGRDRFTYGGMFNKSAAMPAPVGWVHYVRVDSADAAAGRATKAGGTIINGPMEVPGGDRIAAIIDPQGAMFAVHSKAKA